MTDNRVHALNARVHRTVLTVDSTECSLGRCFLSRSFIILGSMRFQEIFGKIIFKSAPRRIDSMPNYWLMKTEPSTYSIQDLAKEKKKTTHWDGVRNYQARNFMRDDMKIGDEVLIYHSNADPPAIVGRAKIVKESYPDFTAWDKNDKHFDPKSSPENPRWFMVDIQLVEVFKEPLELPGLKKIKALDGMALLQKGSRLSVQPVKKKELDTIKKLAARK